MQVLRHHAGSERGEWHRALHDSVGSTQLVDAVDEQCARAIGQRDGEEVGGAWDRAAAIAGHRGILWSAWAWGNALMGDAMGDGALKRTLRVATPWSS